MSGALLAELIGDRAGGWDRAGRLPDDVLRRLGAAGVLCAGVSTAHGGLGLSTLDNGELTATAGALCSSVRSVMTSQGIAAWMLARHAPAAVRDGLLRRLTGGDLVAVALSEPGAGSDLSAIASTVHRDGDGIVVSGHKVWVTAAAYADTILVFARDHTADPTPTPTADPTATGGGDRTAGPAGGAVVAVPSGAPGVTITAVPDPLGCRAAGHATVDLDAVRLPASHLVSAGTPLPWLVASAMAYGRLSVAWGCVGILRACRRAAVRHARTREQSGTALARHQLVARHLAELWTGEQVATRVCEHASRCWDTGSVDAVAATVLAKHVAAREAVAGATIAVQVLGAAAARDGHVVARAYRDAKLMEIIEGTTEICQLLLADHALTATP